MSFLLGLVLVGFSALSVRKRVRNRVKVFEGGKGEEAPPQASPASRALIELVGMAGGIFIAVTALASFLEFGVPGKVPVFGIEMNPVALVSLLVAIIQPFFGRRR